eukprot:TRINITY_DN23544_c0_g1_i1.p2 TRINITY_DN23544_c0_g1~~TRINITY_DN23544_c0_g1_i1.p2  ORF type:complete len:199 (+),score=29.35 TRINITY_DN23544_c0_g1_i1:97-693(+)
MIRRPPRSTHCISSAASDVYKRQYQRRVHGMFHNTWSMEAYKHRNFGGEAISASLAAAIKPMDKLAEQFVAADLVVLVTPMHNFSLPGIVKTYFDSVMQSKITFKYEGDKQIGLMGKSKFLTLYTSMGSYMGTYGFMDNLKTIVKIELDFMGFKEYEFVHAATGMKTTYDSQIEKNKRIDYSNCKKNGCSEFQTQKAN